MRILKLGLILSSTILIAGCSESVVQLQTDSTTEVNEIIMENPISVNFDIHKRAGKFVPTVKIVNHSEKRLSLKHPSLQGALAFVITNKSGNLVNPVGIAKVSPPRQTLVLKPNEIFEYQVSEQEIELAKDKKHYFPFLSRTALFGYPLQKGETYRMITVYRPYEGQEGICSKEKLIEVE